MQMPAGARGARITRRRPPDSRRLPRRQALAIGDLAPDERQHYRDAGNLSLGGGVETVLATASLANPTRNVFFRLEGRASGNTLTVAMDGVDKATAVDSTFSAGAVGLVIQAGGTTSFHRADNFLATAF